MRRMLADPKSEALSKIFAAEWLNLQNLQDVQPDAFLYPNFDRNLADSMRRETELFFDSIVREDRNVLDLLTANYTFVDEAAGQELRHPEHSGHAFPAGHADRSEPFRIAGARQHSDADVGFESYFAGAARQVGDDRAVRHAAASSAAECSGAQGKPRRTGKCRSVRERMEQHRKNEPCHSCHQLMDPIGLSLENFDAVGAWRIERQRPADRRGKQDVRRQPSWMVR